MHPKEIFIKDYTYNLPEDKVANYPLAQRDASKLLIYKNGSITEDNYRNIDKHIPSGSLLVFNNTKVVEARLLFKKPTGGIVEIFCLEPGDQYTDISTAMMQQDQVQWKCLVGGASKWKKGQVLEKQLIIDGKETVLRASYKEKRTDHFIIELSWSLPHTSFAELLHHAGAVPLPPYIKREAEADDTERYQTIYAHHDGSVAAPTAGLHFTSAIFENLKKKDIQTDFVTLHVGAGTFKPVKAETIGDHEMHAEYIDVTVSTIENILTRSSQDIIAVGTTSLRTIESLYWLGVMTILAPSGNTIPSLAQWDPYELDAKNISTTDALQSLIDHLKKNKLTRLITKTRLLIAPGYKPKVIKGLITNFHQPGSTLLLLVAALIGKNWKLVYNYALQNDFRFLSYGDGNLLWID